MHSTIDTGVVINTLNDDLSPTTGTTEASKRRRKTVSVFSTASSQSNYPRSITK